MGNVPAQSFGDESLDYGSARGVLAAVNATLRRRDPKQAKANSKNSPGGRKQTNVLRTVSRRALLKELLRREAVEQTRIGGRERKARWRMRQDLKKAVAAAARRDDED